MPNMNVEYRNATVAAGAQMITHIGLVDNDGVELSGGEPAYTRKAVTWDQPSGGVIRPTSDLVFDIPAGKTVAGWRGFTAEFGGTDFGGKSVVAETFASQGQCVLLKDGSGIRHENPI